MTEFIHAQVMRKCLREQSKPLAVASFWRYVKGVAQRLRSGDGFVEWGLVRSRVDEALEVVERDFPGIAADAPTTPSASQRAVGGLSDAELLQRSATTGIQELGAVAWDAFEGELRGTRSGRCWQDLDPVERQAWRGAAQAIWEMAR